jgi:hypothetical protein
VSIVSTNLASAVNGGIPLLFQIGRAPPAAIEPRWTIATRRDPILKAFMDRMTEATVLHGKRDGTVISHISLI